MHVCIVASHVFVLSLYVCNIIQTLSIISTAVQAGSSKGITARDVLGGMSSTKAYAPVVDCIRKKRHLWFTWMCDSSRLAAEAGITRFFSLDLTLRYAVCVCLTQDTEH